MTPYILKELIKLYNPSSIRNLYSLIGIGGDEVPTSIEGWHTLINKI